MSERENDALRDLVRKTYAETAAGGGSCCGGGGAAPSGGCCSGAPIPPAVAAETLGYAAGDAGAAPEGAYLGLGCGNPQALAGLRPGETVLDLGCGGGFDCFLAARRVGPSGRVIGVDMTPEMVAKARENARKGGAENVSFRLGEIEHLPVADASVDVIISNCVINLSPEKGQVFREAFRVLKPGGRLAVSDVVRTGDLPPALAGDGAAYCGCVSGAVSVSELETLLRDAGFSAVTVEIKSDSAAIVGQWLPGSGVENFVASASITATKE